MRTPEQNKSHEEQNKDITTISSEIREMRDPLDRVKRALEEIRTSGKAIKETNPELLALLVNNTWDLVEEVERLRKKE